MFLTNTSHALLTLRAKDSAFVSLFGYSLGRARSTATIFRRKGAFRTLANAHTYAWPSGESDSREPETRRAKRKMHRSKDDA